MSLNTEVEITVHLDRAIIADDNLTISILICEIQFFSLDGELEGASCRDILHGNLRAVDHRNAIAFTCDLRNLQIARKVDGYLIYCGDSRRKTVEREVHIQHDFAIHLSTVQALHSSIRTIINEHLLLRRDITEMSTSSTGTLGSRTGAQGKRIGIRSTSQENRRNLRRSPTNFT